MKRILTLLAIALVAIGCRSAKLPESMKWEAVKAGPVVGVGLYAVKDLNEAGIEGFSITRWGSSGWCFLMKVPGYTPPAPQKGGRPSPSGLRGSKAFWVRPDGTQLATRVFVDRRTGNSLILPIADSIRFAADVATIRIEPATGGASVFRLHLPPARSASQTSDSLPRSQVTLNGVRIKGVAWTEPPPTADQLPILAVTATADGDVPADGVWATSGQLKLPGAGAGLGQILGAPLTASGPIAVRQGLARLISTIDDPAELELEVTVERGDRISETLDFGELPVKLARRFANRSLNPWVLDGTATATTPTGLTVTLVPPEGLANEALASSDGGGVGGVHFGIQVEQAISTGLTEKQINGRRVQMVVKFDSSDPRNRDYRLTFKPDRPATACGYLDRAPAGSKVRFRLTIGRVMTTRTTGRIAIPVEKRTRPSIARMPKYSAVTAWEFDPDSPGKISP